MTRSIGWGKGHAVVIADLNGDGNQEIFQQVGGAYPGDKFFDAFFENPGPSGNCITIRLLGRASNRFGVGARVKATFEHEGRTHTIHRIVSEGGTFGANP